MKFTDRLKLASNAFRNTQKNSLGDNLGNSFLRFGNKQPLMQDWSKIIVNDADLYSGYIYAAVNRIAGRGSYLAANNLKTRAAKAVEDAAKKQDAILQHPYLEIIDKSKTFTNNQFWTSALKYLNLKGCYYLLAIRAVGENKVGAIQEFKLLNPMNIERVWNADHTELAGYRESRNGYIRDIPPEMIIPIFLGNPYDTDEPYSTIDAAKETQFTMKQAGDYTRHSLKNNMAAPGIISTDVELEAQEFANFRARIINQEKGEPLFGNGAGAVKWDAMQIDMDKASLSTINEINRDVLLAVTGVSKTTLNIEQSGVTRDTAKVQSDLFITDTVIPQLQEIIDALNQDYKVNYESEYEKYQYNIYIDSPLGTDREAELKDVDIRTKSFELYNTLVNKGFTAELAAKYSQGNLELSELGEPTEEPAGPVVPVEEPVQEEEKAVADVGHGHMDIVHNQLDEDAEIAVAQNQGVLQNSIVNMDARLVAEVINKVAKNAFTEQDELISKTKRNEYENELKQGLQNFYAVILSIYGAAVMNRRLKETSKVGTFQLNSTVRAYIRATAKLAAESHINTILDDILAAVRQLSLEGATQEALVQAIRQKFNAEISQNRAKTIARTETNRAFTQAQYQADKQFIAQNNLEGRAYKQWVTRSGNPCSFCSAMAARPPIPFKEAFADVGDVLETVTTENDKTKVNKLTIGFEDAEAGNLHPNCSCIYQLIIE